MATKTKKKLGEERKVPSSLCNWTMDKIIGRVENPRGNTVYEREGPAPENIKKPEQTALWN